MSLLRSRRALLATILIVAAAAACDSPSQPSTVASTDLRPPTTNPAFPDAQGSAVFTASGPQRELEVEVQDVPAGTELVFFYNGNNFGTATADAQGRAGLSFDTRNGDAVPFDVTGALIRIESEGILVVSGTF